MSESDTETLFDEPISCPRQYSKTKTPDSKIEVLGKRGFEWQQTFLKAVSTRIKIGCLKKLGWSKDEIAEAEPGYEYDAEYHGLTAETGYRRNLSCSDLSSCIGTRAGYAAWEYCGGPCFSNEV
jgi:hypothetical protein